MSESTLQQKNDFVASLRDYLMKKYNTDKHYTFGEGNFEGRIDRDGSGATYSLVRGDTNKPRNITGFCFRKDLCRGFFVPEDSKGILSDIQKFSKEKGIESELLERKFGEELDQLNVAIAGKEYIVSVYIDDGYAGEILVNFMESPSNILREASNKVTTAGRPSKNS